MVKRLEQCFHLVGYTDQIQGCEHSEFCRMPFAAVWVSQVGEGLGEKGLIHEAGFPALLRHALPEVSRLQRIVVSEHVGLSQDNDASLGEPDRLLYGCSID